MKALLVNFALFFGLFGFVGVLFLIIAGFIGCCNSITTLEYHHLILAFFSVSVLIFGLCMYNNCCHAFRKNCLSQE